MGALVTPSQNQRENQAARKLLKRSAKEHWAKKTGMFNTTPGLEGLRLESQAYDAIKKFVEHFEKLEFTLVTPPLYQLIPPFKEKYRPAGYFGDDIQMWVPTEMKGLPENHPWYVPDADQYQCWAWFRQEPKSTKVWLPDEYITRHGLPSGFTLRD